MKREKIIDAIEATLQNIGVPEHLYGIKVRPSEVAFDCVFGSRRLTFSARSGTKEPELQANLERLQNAWREHTEAARAQIDLEEAIAAKSAEGRV